METIQSKVSYTLKELSEKVGGIFVGNPDLLISGISRIEDAKSGDLVYVDQAKKIQDAEKSSVGVILCSEFKGEYRKSYLIVKNAKLAFAKLLALFHPAALFKPGIHPTAVIGSSAVISSKAMIGYHVVIEKNAVVGDNVVLSPFVYIGEDVQIGDGSFIHPHVSLLTGVKIGKNCIIHPGAVIGGEGFGYVSDENGHPLHIPQVGTVVLEDDVEVGANSTIDRATLGETRIGKGTKIDNLVQIGHNCEIGENCLIAAMVGFSGSVRIGKGTMIGGQAGFRDHIEIGENCIIAGGAEVWGNVKANSFVSGAPARPHSLHLKILASLEKLPEILKKSQDLRKKEK